MRVITFPEKYNIDRLGDIICFMGGGMGNTEWHERFINKLNEYTLNHLVLVNPYNPNIESVWEQVEWEFYHLNNFINRNFIFSMYFDKYTDQPISMYELGRATALGTPCSIKIETGATQVSVPQSYGFPLVLSMHEEAPKKQDLICQCGLVHQEIQVRTPEEHALEVVKQYRMIKNQMI